MYALFPQCKLKNRYNNDFNSNRIKYAVCVRQTLQERKFTFFQPLRSVRPLRRSISRQQTGGVLARNATRCRKDSIYYSQRIA